MDSYITWPYQIADPTVGSHECIIKAMLAPVYACTVMV